MSPTRLSRLFLCLVLTVSLFPLDTFAAKQSNDMAYIRATRGEHDKWLLRTKKNPDILHGQASWYGKDFHRRPTASGVPYDMYTFTAAHRSLPLGTVVRVTDCANGKNVMVCITDRGPYVAGRVIDLSYVAAGRLGLERRGVCQAKLEVVSDANGRPLSENSAFYVQFQSASGKSKLGPYKEFADAAAIQEALSSVHPDADVVLE